MSNLIRITKILGVGSYDLSPKYEGGFGTHPGWEFVYIDSGAVNYIIEGESGVLRQGEILFHRPGELHATKCDGKRGASMITLIFECHSHAMKYFDQKVIRVPKTIVPILRQMIDECRKTYQRSQPLAIRNDAPKGGDQLIRNLLESFLILLMREQASLPKPPAEEGKRTKDKPVPEICAYLRTHLGERVTLEDLSEQFHFGKAHLCVLFKRSMGKTIIDYHLDLKIAEAKRLLHEEAVTVREISEQLGFESPEYFSRCFLRRTGYSPRSFRNLLITDTKEKLD